MTSQNAMSPLAAGPSATSKEATGTKERSGRDGRGGFAMVPSWLIRSEVSDRAVRLYALLADHRNRKTGECSPGRKRLAAILGCHTDTLDRAMDELKAQGAVEVVRPSTGRKGDTNFYSLPDQSVPVRTGHSDQSVPMRPDQSVPVRPKPYEGEPDSVLHYVQNGSAAAADGAQAPLAQPHLPESAAHGEANPASREGDVLPIDENAKRARAYRLGLDQKEAA